MSRGGPRVAGPGKKNGRPRKTAAAAVSAAAGKGKARRDVAHEVIALLNVPADELPKRLKKSSGEACYVFSFLWDEDTKAFKPRTSFAWDVYKYVKECVDMRPMVRREEQLPYDPDAPIRVLVEHIGTVSVTTRGGAK